LSKDALELEFLYGMVLLQNALLPNQILFSSMLTKFEHHSTLNIQNRKEKISEVQYVVFE
jgi:hypothetical protein